MRRRFSLGSLGALSLCALASGAFLLKTAAEEPHPKRLACPSCHEPREGARCPKDGAPLVRADLVVFGDTLARLAAFDVKDPGLENPFGGLVGKDGLPDVGALEKLVQDYKAARAQSRFTPFGGRLPLAAPAAKLTPEKGAISALKSIAVGKGLGYLVEAAPSTSEPHLRWYAKASPEKPAPGARFFFTNQVGLVYFSTEPFTVDPKSCDVPPGLKLAAD